jgi:GAF domain-containing protein
VLSARAPSEGILLEAIARDTLLDVERRVARLREAVPQILSVLDDETDAVAMESTLACLLWEAMPHASWCGFYRRVGERTLAVGPYQGTMGCLRIDFARGVCGACARTGEVQLVPDVERFSGHIACDSRTRSELVLPVFDHAGAVRAVLDLDSTHLDAFSSVEAEMLADVLRLTLGRASTAW